VPGTFVSSAKTRGDNRQVAAAKINAIFMFVF